MVSEAFGESLRKARLGQGMTQQDTAMRCQMSPRYYQDLEAGNKQPTITTIFRLCTALGIEPDKLISPVWKQWKKKNK